MPGFSARGSCALSRLALVFVATIGVSGCGGRMSSGASRDERLWPAGAWVPARPPFDLSAKEPSILDLPWAGDQGLDREPALSMRRFIVNLERSPALMFKGMRWSLDRERRTMAFERLAVEVARRASNVPTAPAVPVAVLLRIDYRTSWEDVRDVIQALHRPPATIRSLHLAVAASDPDEWWGARLEMQSVGDPFDPARALPVVLGMSGTVGSSDRAARVSIGDRTLTFATGDPYAAGAPNDLANANWRDVLATLKRARATGDGSASLIVNDGVPWAYVAMTLGMLLEAEIVDVRLGQMSFHLSTPSQKTLSWHSGDRDPRDWHPAFALGVGAAIALAVFALGALTARRRRRPYGVR